MVVGVPGEGSCCSGQSSQVHRAYRVGNTLGGMVTDRMRIPGDGFWSATADLPQRSKLEPGACVPHFLA